MPRQTILAGSPWGAMFVNETVTRQSGALGVLIDETTIVSPASMSARGNTRIGGSAPLGNRAPGSARGGAAVTGGALTTAVSLGGSGPMISIIL